MWLLTSLARARWIVKWAKDSELSRKTNHKIFLTLFKATISVLNGWTPPLFKHGAILYNGAEVLSLSITNPNGRPMLPFDWLIHSGLILARCALPLNSGERRVLIKTEMFSVFILLVSNAFYTESTIASKEQFTKKIDFFNLNFLILFLHLR